MSSVGEAIGTHNPAGGGGGGGVASAVVNDSSVVGASVKDALETLDRNSTNQPLFVGPTRQYTTIQDAINAAAVGQTVYIDPGTYGPFILDHPVNLIANQENIDNNNIINVRIVANLATVPGPRCLIGGAGWTNNGGDFFFIKGLVFYGGKRLGFPSCRAVSIEQPGTDDSVIFCKFENCSIVGVTNPGPTYADETMWIDLKITNAEDFWIEFVSCHLGDSFKSISIPENNLLRVRNCEGLIRFFDCKVYHLLFGIAGDPASIIYTAEIKNSSITRLSAEAGAGSMFVYSYGSLFDPISIIICTGVMGFKDTDIIKIEGRPPWVSNIITGNGGAQITAHSLGHLPSRYTVELVAPFAAGPLTINSVTSINVSVTANLGCKYRIILWD
jgi:hypothetical protein